MGEAIGARHEPLARLGELGGGGTAYLVRDRASGELEIARLLKRRKDETGGKPIVVMLRELDGSVPAPSAACPNCGTPLGAWAQKCVKCGARLAAAPAAADLARREPGRYTLLGTLPVYGGGAVSFAVREDAGAVVALHAREWLDADGGERLELVEAGPLDTPPMPATGSQPVIPEEPIPAPAAEPVVDTSAAPVAVTGTAEHPMPADDAAAAAAPVEAAPEAVAEAAGVPEAEPAPPMMAEAEATPVAELPSGEGTATPPADEPQEEKEEKEEESGHIADLPTAVLELPNRSNQGQLHEPTQWMRTSRQSPGGTVVPASAGSGVPVPKICPMCGTEYQTEARFCPKDGSALRPKGGSDPLVGQVIADRYHVLKRIGEGGMGRVYLAEHVRMGRMCALKVMRSALLSDDEAMARFAREASNAARILHPNVVAVFDYGESDGVVYLVMEYVEGEPLSTVLQREKPLPVARVLAIVKQVTDALVAAHEMGVVHRDLKPDNILLSRRGEREVAKVVDFGIAKAVTESPHEALTRSGLVIGTPEFMSPEQLLGDPVDARTDLYSLGCILFLMLTGSQAAEAPTREAMLKRRLHELPPHPRAVNRTMPPELDAIVVRLLASTPAERFPSAAAVRDALERVPAVESEGSTPSSAATVQAPALRRPSTPTRLRFLTPIPEAQPRRRGRRVAVMAGILVIAAGAAAVPFVRRLREAAPRAVAADSLAHADSALVGPAAAAGATSGATAGVAVPAGVTAGTQVATVPGAVVRPPVQLSPGPALPRPEPPRVAAADASVLAPLEAYAAALTSGDMERVRQAYPGMTREQEKNLSRLFEQARVLSARVSGPEVDVNGETARVRFTLVQRTRFRSSGDEIAPRTPQHATLARRGNGWVLVALR